MSRIKIFLNYGFSLLIGVIFIMLSCVDGADTQNPSDAIEKLPENNEQHRPLFHFTPPSMWMNDPNGMVYYEGEYHLFYQHYPEDIVWGPMHWGHAVSTDLVNWKHLPIALYPDSLGYIFSGSAVIDWKNTSGFGMNNQPPMIAIFTHHDPVGEKAGTNTFQYQSIAYSNDKGRTWTKYAGNPVIPNPGIRDFRDPKVIWDETHNQWVMVFAAWDHIKIYTSPNLKEWKHSSDFGKEWGTHAGVWECPDFFPMTVEGSEEVKWVLLLSINPGSPNGGSGTQYFIGDFDGANFSLDEGFKQNLGIQAEIVPEGKVFEDFEESRYGHWEKEGFAFGNYPAAGSFRRQNEVTEFRGQQLVNTYFNGDETEGTLTSPSFQIKNGYINFLVGGGRLPGKTGMDLIIDGVVQRTVTGNNQEKLSWHSWDVRNIIGKYAKLKIYDQATVGWGHILIDQIVFADAPASSQKEKAVWLDYGRDNYAGVTWSDIPKQDGRRIFIGWMSNWEYANVVPTVKWRSAMTLPRELKLIRHDDNSYVTSQPVKELESLRSATVDIESQSLRADRSSEIFPLPGGIVELILELDIIEKDSTRIVLEFSNDAGEKLEVGLDLGEETWYSDRRQIGRNNFSTMFVTGSHSAPVQLQKDHHVLHVFLDVASIELFANNGLTVITDIFFPTEPLNRWRISCTKGEVRISGRYYSLKSANFEDSPM